MAWLFWILWFERVQKSFEIVLEKNVQFFFCGLKEETC